MSAQRLIPIKTVEDTLRSYHCKPLKGKTTLNTANWWQWPWGGAPFILPNEDGYIDEWAYRRIIADMAMLAPSGWEFPPLSPEPKKES